MSELQKVCSLLEAADHDIMVTAQLMSMQAQRCVFGARQAAALVTMDDAIGSYAALELATVLSDAAKAADEAARLLAAAALQGRAFISRTVAGSGGGVVAAVATPGAAGISMIPVADRDFVGEDGISGSAPKQGAIGDCFLIASISAIAHRMPRVLAEDLRRSEHSVYYREHEMDLALHSSGQDLDLALSRDGSTWVGFIERAYIDQHGGYRKVDEGGFPADALEWLTGRPAAVRLTLGMDEVELRDIVARGPAVASTQQGYSSPELLDKFRIVEQHAYWIEGIDDSGKIHLKNPWGKFHPSPMTSDEFLELFYRIDSLDLTMGGST